MVEINAKLVYVVAIFGIKKNLNAVLAVFYFITIGAFMGIFRTFKITSCTIFTHQLLQIFKVSRFTQFNQFFPACFHHSS